METERERGRGSEGARERESMRIARHLHPNKRAVRRQVMNAFKKLKFSNAANSAVILKVDNDDTTIVVDKVRWEKPDGPLAMCARGSEPASQPAGGRARTSERAGEGAKERVGDAR